jgi:CheY-like chemotaxis protein
MTHDRLKVIVADDEGAIAETMALILNAHGYEARAVGSGEAAVDIAPEFHPDFLISDIRMGSMDGIEAAIRVREMFPRCKVVVFSATMVDHQTQARLNRLGFDFLRKPLHPDQLMAQLRK